MECDSAPGRTYYHKPLGQPAPGSPNAERAPKRARVASHFASILGQQAGVPQMTVANLALYAIVFTLRTRYPSMDRRPKLSDRLACLQISRAVQGKNLYQRQPL